MMVDSSDEMEKDTGRKQSLRKRGRARKDETESRKKRFALPYHLPTKLKTSEEGSLKLGEPTRNGASVG